MSTLVPQRRTVLVVDDETLIRLLAADILSDNGFDTLEACDGPEALAILTAHPEIDVLLTDINMPGQPDGLDLAHEARRMRPSIHIVVTSGRVLPRQDELPAGSQFVGKPYTFVQLLEAIPND